MFNLLLLLLLLLLLIIIIIIILLLLHILPLLLTFLLLRPSSSFSFSLSSSPFSLPFSYSYTNSVYFEYYAFQIGIFRTFLNIFSTSHPLLLFSGIRFKSRRSLSCIVVKLFLVTKFQP